MLRCSTPSPSRWLPRLRHSIRPPVLRNFKRFNATQPEIVAPYEPIVTSIPKPPVLRPIMFTLGIAGASYFVATKLTNDETEKWSPKVYSGPWWLSKAPTSEEMQREQRAALAKWFGEQLTAFNKAVENWPLEAKAIPLRISIAAAQSWVNMTEGRQAAYILVGTFCVVHLMKVGGWRRLREFMSRNFVHDPLSGRSFTLLTSTFGHGGLMHLAFNSIALLGFSSTALQYMRAQQIMKPDHMVESHSIYHFMAFHITAGVFAGLVSHIFVARRLFPRLLKSLQNAFNPVDIAAAQNIIKPSLGASGAIYAGVVVTALAFPHAQVSLIFLPMLPIPISVGVGGMVAMDIIGLLRGWAVFDHAAHLGGALFGLIYYFYGPDAWDWMRRQWYRPIFGRAEKSEEE